MSDEWHLGILQVRSCVNMHSGHMRGSDETRLTTGLCC